MKRFLIVLALLLVPSFVWATDISVTAANVSSYTDPTPVTVDGTAGATLTAGQLVYKDSSTGKFLGCDCDDTAVKAAVVGITLNGAANNQPIRVQTGGAVNPGGTVVVGEIYVASGTAGGIAPKGDLAQNDYVSIFGVGITSSKIQIRINVSGVLVP
jgi:hypothetical protein